MVLLPGGTFMMGCVEGDNQCNDDEKPAHRVSLDSFYMDEHEVTVAEYALCVNAGVCISAQFVDNPSYDTFFSNDVRHRNHPVIGINWNSADAYCRWRGKRLPTEAEFEYALRGGQEGYIYPWGTNGTPPTRYGNYSDEAILRLFPSWRQFVNSWFHGYNDGFMGMSPVCSFTRNPFGLCDISGNVWEWTADWYDDNYYQSSPANNPRGPSSGKSRVIRGGSWMTSPRFVRTSYRDNKSPVYWVWDLGFRCSRDAQQTAPPSAPTPPPAPTPAPAVQLTPTPESAVRGRVFARILNVDDEARILVNGQVAVHGYWGRGEHGAQIGHHPGFTEWVEITALCRRGANAFRFWVWNAAIPGTSSATFEVRVNNKIVLRKVFFVNDSSQGVKFDRTFDLHLD
jgi:formylglycine-generating enzyme required for sulfatase activity